MRLFGGRLVVVLLGLGVCGAAETNVTADEVTEFLEQGVEEIRQTLFDLVEYLRAGDERLVRTAPSKESRERQQEVADSGAIELVTDSLQHSDYVIRTLSAELVALLCIASPEHRKKFFEGGALRPLIKAVEESAQPNMPEQAILMGEEAAEALFILAYGGGKQSNKVVHKILIELVQLQGYRSLAKLLDKGHTARGRMWAAAAIGNMAGNYPGNVEEGLSKSMRDMMREEVGMITNLVALADLGPVDANGDRSVWPSQAKRNERHSTTIVAWAAAHAVKNIAFHKAAYTTLEGLGAISAMCYLRESKDWLERTNAEEAVKNAEFQSVEEDCDRETRRWRREKAFRNDAKAQARAAEEREKAYQAELEESEKMLEMYQQVMEGNESNATQDPEVAELAAKLSDVDEQSFGRVAGEFIEKKMEEGKKEREAKQPGKARNLYNDAIGSAGFAAAKSDDDEEEDEGGDEEPKSEKDEL